MIAEDAEQTEGLGVDDGHGAEQRRLGVQRLARVGAEGGGNVERAVLDKGIGRRIPGGVAACLKGGADTAGGEGGGVRFALDQLLAGKLHNDLTGADGTDKGVMLFGGDTGQGLEPMGEMGRALLDRPILHGICHAVGDGGIEILTAGNGLAQRLINVLGQSLTHDVVVEDHTAKHIRYMLCHRNPPIGNEIFL